MLCVSNIRSAMGAGDYFAAVATPSPFLHFWSLSLEEQYYLVWPVLLLTAARCRRARLAVGITLLALLVASLAASVVLTDDRADLELLLAALSQLAVRGGRPAGGRIALPATIPYPTRRGSRLVRRCRTRGRCGRHRRQCAVSRAAGRPADRRRRSPDRVRRPEMGPGDPSPADAAALPWPDQLLAVPVALADPRPADRRRHCPRANRHHWAPRPGHWRRLAQLGHRGGALPEGPCTPPYDDPAVAPTRDGGHCRGRGLVNHARGDRQRCHRRHR